MGFLDSILGRSKEVDWKPTHRGLLKEVSFDELINNLGSPKKAQGGFVYWRGSLDELDPDYDENVYYQISNKDFRGFGSAGKRPSTNRETWFILTNDGGSIRLVADEVGALARGIEKIE